MPGVRLINSPGRISANSFKTVVSSPIPNSGGIINLSQHQLNTASHFIPFNGNENINPTKKRPLPGKREPKRIIKFMSSGSLGKWIFPCRLLSRVPKILLENDGPESEKKKTRWKFNYPKRIRKTFYSINSRFFQSFIYLEVVLCDIIQLQYPQALLTTKNPHVKTRRAISW